MRIIAGQWGGQIIDAPHGHRTHPMSDKIRGALFNSLGDITGLSLLDAYAGSGAISLEALSRGAQSAIAIDTDKNAVLTIKQNARKLHVKTGLKVIQANVSGWSNNNPEMQFDIVIADPPYDAVNDTTLRTLIAHSRVNGLYVLSLPPTASILLHESLELLQRKSYGDAQLVFYRRIQ